MVDFSQLLGGDPGGLLTPEQAGGVNQNFLQAIGAGLMKASGPSPYKPGMTAFSGIGEALQGGLAARRQAQIDAMNQTVARAKMLEALGPLLKQQAYAHSVGETLLPEQQHLLDALLGTVMGRSSAASRAAGMPVLPGAPGAPGAPGVPGTGPRAEGAPSQATGAVPASVDGIKTNFLFDLAKEYNLSPQSVADKEHPQHEFLMSVAKQRATDTDRVHQQTLTDQLSQQKEMDDLGKRIRELRDLGKLTPENLRPIIDRMREIGVDENIIRRHAIGTAAAPEVKPVQTISVGRGMAVPGAAAAPVMPGAGTLPPSMASMMGGIGTPPAPSPAEATSAAGGLPAAPAPVTPPGPPPVSPLRTGAPSSGFLPPPAGALPPLPPTPKPAAAPVVAPPVKPPVVPPAMAPVAPAAQPKLGNERQETPPEMAVRLGYPAEAAAPSHALHPQYQKAVDAETELKKQILLKREQGEIDAENANRKTAFDAKADYSKKLWDSLSAMAGSSAQTLHDNELTRQLVEMPTFNSGHFVGPAHELLQNVKAYLGIDPNASFAHDVFNKSVSQGTMAALGTLKAEGEKLGGGGKVLLQEYNTLQKAVNSVGVGPASNIFLTRLSDAVAKRNIEITNAAVEYMKNNKYGILDEGFTPVMNKIMAAPLYDKGLLRQAQEEGLVKANNMERATKNLPAVPTYPEGFKPPPGAQFVAPEKNGMGHGGVKGAWVIPATRPNGQSTFRYVKPEETVADQ